MKPLLFTRPVTYLLLGILQIFGRASNFHVFHGWDFHDNGPDPLVLPSNIIEICSDYCDRYDECTVAVFLEKPVSISSLMVCVMINKM